MAKQKKDFTNPFTQFITGKQTANIKALNDAEITYRELTLAESDVFAKRMIKDELDADGKPQFDMDEATEVKYEKVSAMLIEPEMSVEELKALPSSAQSAIEEILNLLNDDETDEEGNEKS